MWLGYTVGYIGWWLVRFRLRVSAGQSGWGGRGSNPGPEDYESSSTLNRPGVDSVFPLVRWEIQLLGDSLAYRSVGYNKATEIGYRKVRP